MAVECGFPESLMHELLLLRGNACKELERPFESLECFERAIDLFAKYGKMDLSKKSACLDNDNNVVVDHVFIFIFLKLLVEFVDRTRRTIAANYEALEFRRRRIVVVAA